MPKILHVPEYLIPWEIWHYSTLRSGETLNPGLGAVSRFWEFVSLGAWSFWGLAGLGESALRQRLVSRVEDLGDRGFSPKAPEDLWGPNPEPFMNLALNPKLQTLNPLSYCQPMGFRVSGSLGPLTLPNLSGLGL